MDLVAKAFPHIRARTMSGRPWRSCPSCAARTWTPASSSMLFRRGRTARRLPPAPRPAPLRHRAVRPRPVPTGSRWNGRSRGSGWSRPTRTTSRCSACSSSTCSGSGCSRRCATRVDEIARIDGEKVDLDARPARRPGDVRADPHLGHARLLPDRVARPARAAPEVPAHRVRGPDRRHLAVPAGAGEVGHGLPVPERRHGLEPVDYAHPSLGRRWPRPTASSSTTSR